MTEDPGLVAVGIAEALGRHSLGDVTCLLFGGPEPVDVREVLLAACQLLWDLASTHGQKVGCPPSDVLAGPLSRTASMSPEAKRKVRLPGQQLTSVRLDEDTIERLRLLAGCHDSNIAEEMRTAIRQYVETQSSSSSAQPPGAHIDWDQAPPGAKYARLGISVKRPLCKHCGRPIVNVDYWVHEDPRDGATQDAELAHSAEPAD